MSEAVLKNDVLRSFRDMRIRCLFAAIMVYALWGTPTPEAAGWGEVAVGLLLLMAVGAQGVQGVFAFERAEGWRRGGAALMVYGLTVPLFAGLAAGHAVTAIVRDLIPFLFLLLPLFMAPAFAGREKEVKLLTALTAGLGLAFSLRVLLPYMSGQAAVIDPFLLANAPTVLFTALLGLGLCGFYLYRGDGLKSIVMLGLALVPLAAMALIVQRASFGAAFAAVFILLGIGLWRRPLRMALPLLLLGAAAAVYWPAVMAVFAELWEKHEAVGLNSRLQEAAAVTDALGGSLFSVLFGKGWGAIIVSPAVGGAAVNFTHSLITTYWLKTGLLGLALALYYLYRLGLMVLRLLPRHPVIAFALAGPFAIDILLYASFKSLDFGLVLLLIPLWYSVCRQTD